MDEDEYKIYINEKYLPKLDYSNNNELGKYIKEIILKIKKIYNVILEGFYEINVYFVGLFGMILEIKNIDSYPSKTIDLRIIVHSDSDIYLRVKRPELIINKSKINYYKDNFYINVEQINENDINKVLESSEIIYGDDLRKLKNRWCMI